MSVEVRHSPARTPVATTGPQCRFCGAAAPHVRRPRHVAAVRELRARRAPRRDGAVLSAPRPDLRALPARAARGVRDRPTRSSASTPTSRRTRTPGSRTPATTWTMAVERFGLDPTASSSSSPATTATCCGTSSSAASRRSASSPPRTSPRPRARRASRPRRFFGRELAARLVAEGRRADLLVANNVMAHVPDLNDFVAGMEPMLAPDGVVTIEVPHLLRLDRGQPVRHDLPRALLVLLVPDARAKVFAAHGLEVFDVEELPTPRRLAALLRPAGGRACHPIDARGAPSSPRASARSASTRSRATAAFAAQVEETKWSLLEFLIEPPRGQADRRLRRAGQGQHAAQLLRHPHRPARLHGRPQSRTSRASSCRARTSRSAIPRRSSRTAPTTS